MAWGGDRPGLAQHRNIQSLQMSLLPQTAHLMPPQSIPRIFKFVETQAVLHATTSVEDL